MKDGKPSRFDANVIVIGAGSAGLVSAYIAAATKAGVILIESAKMGGDCLNTGCVPSKALIAAARRVHMARNGAAFGFESERVHVDFEGVMRHVRSAIETISPNDSVQRYTQLGVRCVAGEAILENPWTVRVGDDRYTARNIVLATGADPLVPPIPGLSETPYLTSETLWRIEKRPDRLAVLGGGPIGCELSQAFARLGATVSIFEMQPGLIAGEDPEVGALLQKRFESEGIAVHTGARVEKIDANRLAYRVGDDQRESEFDQLLVATGRRPRTEGFGLDELGIEVGQGGVSVNPFMQTNYPHIYACGDVTGPYQFTHAAAHQAWHCAVNALFRPIKRFRIDYDYLPWAIYTDPEIARVGLSEAEANARDIRFEITLFELRELDRAVTEGETEGFVRFLTPPGKDKILGASVVGAHAAELISTVTLAMKHRIGLNELLATIVPYPAWSEGLKRASGAWKSAHVPTWVYPWLRRYHRLRLRIG